MGIDAPEINIRWEPEAKEFVEKTILNKKVRVEFDKVKLDRYGRLLGYLWVDEILIQEKLLEEGYAKIVLQQHEAKPKYLDRMTIAETWGEDHHNGVWLDEWIIKN